MPRHAKKPTLNAREKAFCRHYITLGDAKAAAEKAGYSKRSAKQLGSRLLQQPAIRAYLTELQAKSNRTVDQMLTAAAKATDSRLPAPLPIGTPPDMRRDMDAEVAAILSRSYVNAGLVENFEIAMGRRKITVLKIVDGTKATSKKPGGQPSVVEVQATMRDAQAANTAAMLLHKELDRQEQFQPPAGSPDDLEAHQTGPGKWDALGDIYKPKGKSNGNGRAA